jgi:hypothetical protein
MTKCLIDGQQLFGSLRLGNVDCVQVLAPLRTAALDRSFPPGAFYENPSHCLGCRRKEVATRVPFLRIVLCNQSQIRLMHEGCGLQRLPRLLVSQPGSRHLPQFVVHERQKLLRGLRLALLNLRQDAGNVAHGYEDSQRAAENPENADCRFVNMPNSIEKRSLKKRSVFKEFAPDDGDRDICEYPVRRTHRVNQNINYSFAL